MTMGSDAKSQYLAVIVTYILSAVDTLGWVPKTIYGGLIQRVRCVSL